MTTDNTTDKDEIAALEKKEKAGDNDARYALAMKYYKGEGVPRNYAHAYVLFSCAGFVHGDAKALNALGMMYDKGVGFPENDIEAENMYRSAAQKGYADALFNLGAMFDRGKGTPQNDKENPVNLYFYAAERGHAKAQYALGMKYYKGEAVFQSYQTAYFWFCLAVANDCDDAIKFRQAAKDALIDEVKKSDDYRKALEKVNRLKEKMVKGDENLVEKLKRAETELKEMVPTAINLAQRAASRYHDDPDYYRSRMQPFLR